MVRNMWNYWPDNDKNRLSVESYICHDISFIENHCFYKSIRFPDQSNCSHPFSAQICLPWSKNLEEKNMFFWYTSTFHSSHILNSDLTQSLNLKENNIPSYFASRSSKIYSGTKNELNFLVFQGEVIIGRTEQCQLITILYNPWVLKLYLLINREVFYFFF